MKKFTILVSLVAMVVLGFASNVIPVETAMKASKNFLSERMGVKNANNLQMTLVYTEYAENGEPVFYRFQVGEKGFIIVSATDLVTPVLAYSLESNYKTGTTADFYCKQYKNVISDVIKHPEYAASNKAAWARYMSTPNLDVKGAKSAPYVEPLITTTWDQYPFYNQYCPASPFGEYANNNDCRTVVGCVALTMGNIMNYYRFPASGHGRNVYIPREYDEETGELLYQYPVQDVNFGTATYNYDAMANNISTYDGELAKLLYHAGVSVSMSYGTVNGSGGSGSQSEKAIVALQNHFGYNQNAQFKNITDVVTSSDLAYKWIDLATAELDAHRPIFFSGESAEAGGHA